MSGITEASWIGWAVAAAAAATAIIPQVRAIWSNLASVLVSRAVLEQDAAGLFLEGAWARLMPARFGVRYYTTDWRFIRPLRRWGSTPSEALGAGSALIFMRGPWPILVLVKRVRGDGPGDKQETTIVYLRWSLDIEQFLGEAAAARMERMEARSGHRHIIMKLHGTQGRRSGEYDSPPISGSRSHLGEVSRPVYWKKEDLGEPAPPDPFQNLVYTAGVMAMVDEVKRWLASRDWAAQRGLSWRLGWLLYGEPGNGKTSLVRSVAQRFDLPVYGFDITTMSNQELTEKFRFVKGNGPAIVLFEDFCRLFRKDPVSGKWVFEAPCTMDALLNCICGVEATDGVFTIFTANDVEKLDDALGVPVVPQSTTDFRSSRPQRVDRCIYLGPPTREMRMHIASRILMDCPDFVEAVTNAGHGESAVQFADRCAQLALAHFWNSKAA